MKARRRRGERCSVAGMRRYGLFASVAFCLVLAVLLVIDINIRAELIGHLYASPADAPHAPVTMVLGAEVYADGRPSPALQSRLDVAIELLRSGKTNVLVMSGGNGTTEIDAMRAYAIARDVPAEVIAGDDAGDRTMSSCVNVRERYPSLGILVVSQADHAARATFICRRVGVSADGVAAPEFTGDRLVVYLVRERLALVVAWVETTFAR